MGYQPRLFCGSYGTDKIRALNEKAAFASSPS